jgi:hypothetical protein
MDNKGSVTDLNLSGIDPIKTFLNCVIGIATSDGLTIRGRLIKVDDKVIWLEKISGDACMIARDDIKRLWRTREVQATV